MLILLYFYLCTGIFSSVELFALVLLHCSVWIEVLNSSSPSVIISFSMHFNMSAGSFWKSLILAAPTELCVTFRLLLIQKCLRCHYDFKSTKRKNINIESWSKSHIWLHLSFRTTNLVFSSWSFSGCICHSGLGLMVCITDSDSSCLGRESISVHFTALHEPVPDECLCHGPEGGGRDHPGLWQW